MRGEVDVAVGLSCKRCVAPVFEGAHVLPGTCERLSVSCISSALLLTAVLLNMCEPPVKQSLGKHMEEDPTGPAKDNLGTDPSLSPINNTVP